jgi:hypothetical protein
VIKPGTVLRFQARLENWAKGMDYCALAVPAKITQALGTRKAVPVMASINGCEAFEVSLFPAGGGQHYIRVRAQVRRHAKVQEGDLVKVRVRILDRRQVDLPDDLIAALTDANASKKFDALTPGRRSYAVRRINAAARPETRKKRIAEAVELALGEAEQKADRGAR